MGEAAGPAELHPFDIRLRDKRERWEEAVRRLVPMFTKESWEFHGEYFDFPLRNVLPSRQKPHPPLWVACSQLDTIGKAGEWGMGALGFQFVTPEAARAWVHAYYNAFVNNAQKLTDYPATQHRRGVGLHVRRHRRGGEAKADGWTFFQFALGFYYGRKGVDAPGTSDCGKEYQSWKGGPERQEARLRPDRLARDDPPEAAPVPESRVDQVILLNQAGKNTTRTSAIRSSCSPRRSCPSSTPPRPSMPTGSAR
jgi:hypothetical protein